MYFLTCVPVCIHAYQHASRRLSNYITPNNMKVLNHFMYIEYGCGMKSVVVFETPVPNLGGVMT
jgi:hypothetical protein